MDSNKEPSLKMNMVLNAVKGIMAVVFPLITFPYVTNILGVENIGQYNFANSIISYFVLLAGLGINIYAIREGSALREKKKEFKIFANQIFTINVVSTIVAYLLLAVIILLVPKLHSYITLLIILSFQIMANTIGVDWIYSIYEDYKYITIRSIIFQFVSMILLFLLVHTEQDLIIYTWIAVFATAGASIWNYIHAKKYLSVRLTKNIDFKKHIKPIMVLFAMSVTVTIYVSSDTTILGFMCDDRTVGIYAVSVKIYLIVKTILASVLIVSIPRLSALYGKGRINDFTVTAEDIYKTLLTLTLPTITGIIILRRQIILLISGYTYVDASSSLMLLSIALFFCMTAWFWGQCILVPMKRENEVFKITVISAAVNIILNLILIPIWKENAAAFTTMLAEGCSFLLCMYKGKQICNVKGFGKITFKVGMGCVGIWIVGCILKEVIYNDYLLVFTTILCSIITYLCIELSLKNEAIYSILHEIRQKTGSIKNFVG